MKILIVDDDPAILKLYSRIFSEQDYAVTFANSAITASALIKANHYNLLITDLMLGDGLGTELAQLFARKSPGAKSLIVTGSRETDDLDFSAVLECLTKPLEIDRFMEAVTKALANPPQTVTVSHLP